MVEFLEPYSDEQRRVIINLEQHYDAWLPRETCAIEATEGLSAGHSRSLCGKGSNVPISAGGGI